MLITVASGKGGTGKTTVAVNIASILAKSNQSLYYVDCDVEEPNGALFLNPEINSEQTFSLPKPDVIEELCDGCGICKDICRFNSIVIVRDKAIIFPELCHSCGGCTLVCPIDAISEIQEEIGVIRKGNSGDLGFIEGRLKIGIPTAVPLIKEVKKALPCNCDAIIDAPAGTSCPVIETVRGTDYVLLVTEPTPFGLHDLMIAVETVRKLNLPFGVVINRSGIGDDRVNNYCIEEGIPLMAEIPDSRSAAELYSRGKLLYEKLPEFKEIFESIPVAIKRELIQFKNNIKEKVDL
ncbi:MAG: P-loop NTPase [candidate division Zixibacteria bacterium]|nr:P-loop NTPase [candidate division Zixibacteria bacterium]